MARELIFHVGTMKSGTTYLQSILARNRGALHKAGWSYPGRRPNQQHAVYGLCGSEIPWIREANHVMKHLGEELVDQVRSTEGHVILSSEALSTLREEAIAGFIEAVGRPSKVIFTVRPLWKVIPSAWQQYLRGGGTLAIESYIRRDFQATWDPEETKAAWQTYAYGRAVKRWASTGCPIEVIEVLPNDAPNSQLWDSFRAAAGLPTHAETDVAPTDRNPSIQLESAEILRRVNNALNGREDAAELRRLYLKSALFPLAGEALGRRPRLPLALAENVNDWSRAETEFMLEAATRVVSTGDVARRLARPEDCSASDVTTDSAAIYDLVAKQVARLLIAAATR